MTRFHNIERLPPMPKYETLERFLADPRPEKMLLASGAFKNDEGVTPLFDSVRRAVERVHHRGLPRDYLDVAGYVPFIDAMDRLLFGEAHDVVARRRVATAHTPGGTVALRIGAELIRSLFPEASIWVSDPTWGNHIKVFQAAGLRVRQYNYYNAERHEVDAVRMFESLRAIPPGDVAFFQAATHNPTCVDPSTEQWRELSDLVVERNLLPFFDVAFFGFRSGIEQDLEGFRSFCRPGREALVAASLSKSFALYNERVGSFSVVAATDEDAHNAMSHVRHSIRANYSNPPLHGAALITEILTTPELFADWEADLQKVRRRMTDCRKRLVELLGAHGGIPDVSHVTREQGMFTQLPLTAAQIDELREQHAVYLSSDGRINVTAMTDPQMQRFCSLLPAYLV